MKIMVATMLSVVEAHVVAYLIIGICTLIWLVRAGDFENSNWRCLLKSIFWPLFWIWVGIVMIGFWVAEKLGMNDEDYDEDDDW